MTTPTPGSTPGPAPGPGPEQDARVRRLLAEVRHDGPVPPDVADRLDGVLADLSRERAGAASSAVAHPPAPVADLAARRRRVRGLLVAAAVVVVGLGAGRLVEALVDGGGSTAGSSVASEDSTASGVAPTGAPPPVAPRLERAYAAVGVERVHRATFTADVTRVRRLVLGSHATEDAPTARSPHAGAAGSAAEAAAERRAVRMCTPAGIGAGRRVPVRYAGRPAVLVLRPATGGSQVADLYLCGADAVVRSVTLPAT